MKCRATTLSASALLAISAISTIAACSDPLGAGIGSRGPLEPGDARAAVAPTGCRILESQAWWSPAPDVPLGGRSRHVHTSVCFPYERVIDGPYTFSITSTLHRARGWYLRNVRVQVASKETGVKTLANVSRTDVRCDTIDCVFTTPVTVDLSGLPAGEWEFRFHTEIRPTVYDRIRLLATNGWVACVRSCTGVTPQAVHTGETEGRGWYRDSTKAVRGYVNGRFVDWLPSGPVSGTWCPHLRTLKGAGDEPVTHSFISVDPDFHMGKRGLVLLDAPGTFDGRRCIDTTRLANGTHKLFIRADWQPGPLAGALLVRFRVRN